MNIAITAGLQLNPPGFGAGLALFFLRNLAQVLGETGQVPPVMAAFAPVAVAVMLALALLLKLEEG